MSTPKRKANVAKVMKMAKLLEVEVTSAEAQKIVNLWVEQGIEITLNLAKKTPRNLIAFTNWIFPRIGWGLNRLNWSDTDYDDYKRRGGWYDKQSYGRDIKSIGQILRGKDAKKNN